MKKGYVLPSIERRVKFELARKNWKVKDLQARIQEILKTKIGQSRVQAIIKTNNPNSQTIALLAEALGISVKLFFEEQL